MEQQHSNIVPRLQTGCAQPYVAVAIMFTRAQWHLTKPVVNEVTEWLHQKDIKITGPLFYRYWAVGEGDEPSRVEIGFPVPEPMEGDGRILTGTIPNGTFATLLHCGCPEDTDTTVAQLQHWANEQGLQYKKQKEGDQEVWDGRFEFHLTHSAGNCDSKDCRIAVALLVDE